MAEFGLQFGSLFGAYLAAEVIKSIDLKTKGVYIAYSSLGGTVYSLLFNSCSANHYVWRHATTFTVTLIPFLSDSALGEKEYFVPTAFLCYFFFQLFKEGARKVYCPDLFEQDLRDEIRQQQGLEPGRNRLNPFSRIPISLEGPRSLAVETPLSAPISIQENTANRLETVSSREP